ncbi:MAG: hypothetical protein M3Q99_08090 [Acidobacteriota bacterium]|nr:hypothetical protein [Acidobacteriota bacterium]
MQIPINANTFKKSFLDGDGNFEISTDQDGWKSLYEAGKPFSKDVDSLAEIKFSIGTSKDLKFGESDKLALKVGFNSEAAGLIDLIWAADESDLIKKYQLESFLTADKLYMALVFNAKADGKVKGKFPTGPLTANFGIGAGGYVGYTRLVPYQKTKTVKEIMTDLFAETRLPQKINKKDEIPKEGEVVILSYGGYLNLSAGVHWGYSLTGTRSFDVKDLHLAANYNLKLVAEAKIGYRLAGDFSIEVRRGNTADWARFVVRKKRRSEFNFAADVGFTGKFELDGLPESADDFLAALFGTKAKTFLDYFAKAEKFSSLEELEKAVGKIAKQYLQKLSDNLIGKALSNGTLQEFLAAVKKVTDFYKTIDERVINLYEDFLGKIPQLNKILDDILKLQKFENLSKLTDAKTWEIIKKLSGEKFYNLLLEQDEFEKFLKFIQTAKDFVNDGVNEEIRNFIADLKEEFPLDGLFKELEKFNTPAKLKTLADEKLQGLVEKLLGKAFDELGNFKDASEQINAALKQITKFKEKWYEKITASTKQSFNFNLNYAYSQANESDALIDVEINLSNAAGQSLADSAAVGDFAEILRQYDSSIVRINPNTVLTQKLTKSAHLQVNVLGWGYERLVELLQKVEHAIETEAGGLIHVFTIETQLEQLSKKTKRKKLLEEVQSNFLLRAVGATFQPSGDGNAPFDEATNKYVIATLKNMAVKYELLYRDTETKPEELRLYLDLAELLGLIPSRERMVRELQSQFPDGLGEVSVEYIVRYDDQTVRNAFTLSGDELKNWARRTIRQLIAAKYTGMREIDWLARVGFAYSSQNLADIYYNEGFTAVLAKAKAVSLPAWFTGGVQLPALPLTEANRQLIVTLYNIERSYVERLNKLDILIDKCLKEGVPVPVDDLAKASRDFVGMADDLEDFGRENSFFIAFDKLTQAGSNGKWRRESAMVLTVKPNEKETVVKYLMG